VEFGTDGSKAAFVSLTMVHKGAYDHRDRHFTHATAVSKAATPPFAASWLIQFASARR
jgi:hypothetical protein